MKIAVGCDPNAEEFKQQLKPDNIDVIEHIVMLAANKVKGAYAAVVGDAYSAQRACLSNNCNIITIGSQVTGYKKAEVMIEAYLKETYVYNERSGKKVDRIVEYEREH